MVIKVNNKLVTYVQFLTMESKQSVLNNLKEILFCKEYSVLFV